MKMTKLTTALLLSMVVALLSACAGSNTVSIGDEEYELGAGYYEEWGENDNEDQSGYDIDVYFTSPGMDMVEETGSGAGIYLDLNSAEETPAEGTYTWSEERTEGTLYDAEVFAGDLEEEPEIQHRIEDGTAEVKVSGDTYTITFDLTAEDGTKITGSYKGELTNVDDLYED